jgi:hypothetical protein
MLHQTRLEDILASPHEFDGRQVVVTGTYMRFHENQCLDCTPEDYDDLEDDQADKHFRYRVLLDTDENTKWIGFQVQYGKYLPVIVTGEYRHEPCGHRDLYRAQLTRIVSVEAATLSDT